VNAAVGTLSTESGGTLLTRAQSFLERTDLIRLHALGDALIALSYFLIPALLITVMRHSRALAGLEWALALFAAFILLCGISHALDVVALWYPAYFIQGWEKILAGAVALVTAFMLLPAVDKLKGIPSREALEAANARLAAEVAARESLEKELRLSLADLGQAIQEMEQFASITSHDLQAPLRTISGFSHLLVSRYRPRLDGEALEFLDYIEQGTRQMQTLIQDLLALSRVGNATPRFEERPLAATLERALKALHDTIEKSGAKIEHGELPSIVAAHDLLVQLLQNLIANALKFHRPDVAPLIRIDARRDGDAWLITVADNGIGIPQEQLEDIFAVFRRLHAAHEYEGTGIGLAICRRIAAHHGGRIWATSDGEGSQFHLRLPVTPIAQPRVVARMARSPSKTGAAPAD
jgi:signal transduction histidine kinase